MSCIWQVPSLFQAACVSKPTNGNVSSSAQQQSVSDQASAETQNLIMSEGQATEESSEGKSNTDIRHAEKQPATEGPNASISCSATSSSSLSGDCVVSVRTEQTNNASNGSDLTKTSKGVVIRPITTPSESNGKGYGFLNVHFEQN